MDLSKLTPAPWCVCQSNSDLAEKGEFFVKFSDPRDDLSTDSTMMDRDHAEFIALARNAFEVMMRRKWRTVYFVEGWYVLDEEGHYVPINSANTRELSPDPFTALVMADRWYRENIEK